MDPANAPVFRLGTLIAVTAIVGFAVLLYIEAERKRTLDNLAEFARDQADWAAYQLEADRFRLEIALSNAQNGEPTAIAEAQQRYEIFAARLPVLLQGDARSLLRKLPAYTVAMSKVGHFLERFGPIAQDGLTGEEMGPMLRAVAELRVPLTALSNATVHARTIYELSAKDDVIFYDRTTLVVFAALLLVIAGFVGYALRALCRALVLERHLRESRERLRDFARIASDWYWETDESHRFVYVSQPGRDVRFNPATLVGISVLDLARRLPQNQSAAAVLASRVDQRAPFHDLRLQATARDGSVRYISISGAPNFTRGSKFKGYRGNARDVTAEIEADQTLNAALRAAQSANQAKSAFLANMSHELRTPLNAVIGFSEMLRMVAGDRLNAKEIGYLGDIQASGRHLLGLINSILELAKVEAGRVELASERAIIGDVVAEAVRMLEPNAQQHCVTVMIEKSLSSLPAIIADRMRLRQVFINLISNAVKYTPEGGKVRIEGAQDGPAMVRIAIIDEGIGMRPEDIATALRPFERISSSFTHSREGVGLGLPIADSLVRAHGGSLAISADIGRGTRVDVRLPINPPIERNRAEPEVLRAVGWRVVGAGSRAD